MAGAREEVRRSARVVLWALVLVEHDQGDRGAEREPVFRAGLDDDLVFFRARGRDGGLAWAAAG